MILTHGSNSLGVGGDDNEFIVLYNGISNRGLPITSGSFGSVNRDTSGPLIAPDGLGMPYFNRRNFSSTVISSHNEFKSIFNAHNWTVDFWIKISGGNSSANQDRILAIRNDRTDMLYMGESHYNSAYSTVYNKSFNSSTVGLDYYHWNHFAFVSDADSGKCTLYRNGNYIAYTQVNNNVPDVTEIIFDHYAAYQLNNDLQCYIAQFAIRAYPVWTANFTPPTKMY